MDGRTFWVRPVGSWVLESNNAVAEALIPEGSKSRVSGDGLESNYAVSTHEVLAADFSLKLMNVRKVNYTGSVVNNMGRLADLYHDL